MENWGSAVRPLDGVRVLEIGDYLSASFATRMLADAGAEVTKIDVPGSIDVNRRAGGVDARDPQRSPFFAALARGKKSVTLDVRTSAGAALFLDLVEKSDAIVENFRPGTLERWGIGPAECARRNPDLVLARISGYGQAGPYVKRTAVDNIAQAFSGLVSLTGYPELPPVRVGATIADGTAGMLAAYGVTLALLQRRRGDGPEVQRSECEVVDVALFDALVPMMGAQIAEFGAKGSVRPRYGNSFPAVTPGGAYQCSDGRWVHLDGTGDKVFRNLAQAIGWERWSEDPTLATIEQRYARREELEATVGDWLGKMDSSEAVEILSGSGVPISVVNDMSDLAGDPHVRSRGTLIEIDDPVYGSLLAAGPLPKVAGASVATMADDPPAPTPGAHNREMFIDLLGMDPEAYESLRAEGVI